MLSIITDLTNRIFARSAKAPVFIIGDTDFNAHVVDWAEEEHSREGHLQYELWAAEQVEIKAEWAAMSDEERSEIYCAFADDWYSNNPMAGEGRYGGICMAMLPRKEVN
jgi:hypothetical protein